MEVHRVQAQGLLVHRIGPKWPGSPATSSKVAGFLCCKNLLLILLILTRRASHLLRRSSISPCAELSISSQFWTLGRFLKLSSLDAAKPSNLADCTSTRQTSTLDWPTPHPTPYILVTWQALLGGTLNLESSGSSMVTLCLCSFRTLS